MRVQLFKKPAHSSSSEALIRAAVATWCHMALDLDMTFSVPHKYDFRR